MTGAECPLHNTPDLDKMADYGYKPLADNKDTMLLKAGMHPFKLACMINKGEKKEL